MNDLFTEQVEVGDKYYAKPCWSHDKKPELYTVAKVYEDSYLFRGVHLQETIVMKKHLNELFDK